MGCTLIIVKNSVQEPLVQCQYIVPVSNLEGEVAEFLTKIRAAVKAVPCVGETVAPQFRSPSFVKPKFQFLVLGFTLMSRSDKDPGHCL